MIKGIALAVMMMPAAAGTAWGQPPAAAPDKRSPQVRMLEGVFVSAVLNGAGEVAEKLQQLQPAGMTGLMGTPRARGFILEGYGVFFDVEIPALNQSLVWTVMTIQRDREVVTALDLLGSALASMPEGPSRLHAQQAFKRVAQTVGPVQPPPASPPPKGGVEAANVDADLANALLAPSPGIYDPLKHYTEAVKGQLVDAMLDHSLRMELGPSDWLTVAARDSAGSLTPGGIPDTVTIILRVNGSDLAVYQGDPKRRAEIRAKVLKEAKVF